LPPPLSTNAGKPVELSAVVAPFTSGPLAAFDVTVVM
jgi:hypothetical protein